MTQGRALALRVEPPNGVSPFRLPSLTPPARLLDPGLRASLVVMRGGGAEFDIVFDNGTMSHRLTYYGAVSVNWTDGPREAEVEAICRKYKAGRFNSMEDSYEHAAQPWHHVFGGLEYLSVSRDESAALVARAIEAVYTEYADKLASVPKPAPEQFKRGELIHVFVPNLARDLHTLICTQLRDVV